MNSKWIKNDVLSNHPYQDSTHVLVLLRNLHLSKFIETAEAIVHMESHIFTGPILRNIFKSKLTTKDFCRIAELTNCRMQLRSRNWKSQLENRQLFHDWFWPYPRGTLCSIAIWPFEKLGKISRRVKYFHPGLLQSHSNKNWCKKLLACFLLAFGPFSHLLPSNRLNVIWRKCIKGKQ